ncbi:hypothetical protein [Micromonospora vulcania]|uniref:Extracellular solute-binding protein n=1 Tax=Micromonospora vulcania TaxID=1441873 RepID=A0ABW1H3H1_9ACTN
MTLTGMTWDHPRAWLGLEAFEASGVAPLVAWDRQPLSAFEAYPIARLAETHDFMVVDHPGLGAAVRAGALVAFEDLVDPALVDQWLRSAVGASGASYEVGGRTWAVPIDAAAQVSVRRPDAGVPVVRRWEDVPAVAAEHPVALCLAGPHAGLTLLAMCSGVASEHLLDPATATDAVDLLRAVFRIADRELSLLDPIGIHDGLADGSGATWCPLAYGYVTYADRLAWSDAPSWRGDHPLSVLGGTGLAVAARSAGDPEVRAWVHAFLDERVQTGLVPRAGGQPAHRAVWTGTRPFYADTVATLDAAWVRPRVPGWIPLQDELSELVREAIVEDRDAAAAVDKVNAAYADLLRVAHHEKGERSWVLPS